MCNYFSCIVKRDLSVIWSKKTNAHEDLIEQENLSDDRLENRDFVRIEVIPKNLNQYTKNKDDWIYSEDENNSLPEWYERSKTKIEELVWVEWENSINIQLLTNKQYIKIKDQFCLVCGNSQVEAWDNSQVEAYGNSQVEACDNSQVKAYGNSQVKAWDNSQVEAWGNSQVKACDNSQVKAWGNSQVKACGNSQVKAWDNSQVEACDKSQVKAWGNSQVKACDNSQVKAWGNSQVKACGNSQVKAWDNSQVEACDNSQIHKFSGIVTLKSDLAVITDVYNSQIIVKDITKVIVQEV